MANPIVIETRIREYKLDTEAEQRAALGILSLTMYSSVAEVTSQVVSRTPLYQGTARRSINWEVSGSLDEVRGRVSSSLPYIRFVEEGAAPHNIPIDPLKRWAQLVLGDESAAWGIWRKYAPKFGNQRLPARWMFKEGKAASKATVRSWFRSALRQIADKFGKR